MTSCKKPIHRSMLFYGILFLSIMCVLMAIQTTGLFSSALTRRYTAHMKDVLTYVEHSMDADDLRECINTRVPSEKYNALQQQVNTMVDDFEVLYIYLCIPDEEAGIMYSVLSSTSDAERAAGDTEEYPIMYNMEDYYTREQLVPYARAMQKPGEVTAFFESSEEFGRARTVCKPVVTSDGETIALLCVDTALTEMRHTINLYVWSSISLIVLIVLAFAFVVLRWMRKNITQPLLQLESAATAFSENSRGKRDLNELTFPTPDIRTENEIQALSEAITQMSEDMKHYVQDVLSAEQRAVSAEAQVEDIARMAYEDTLTGAKSKVAYDTKKAELDRAVANGEAEFALVGVELEGADRINDLYGRDARDKFISNACDLIGSVYKYSPIYRVSDTIFAVFLEDDEYRNRDALMDQLNEKLQASEDSERDSWERCAAVAGMTEYMRDAEDDVGKVCRRLEMIMSRNWRSRKNASSKQSL